MPSQIEAVSDLALVECASEPIRIPGAIQPHGYLLAFDAETSVLQHASTNVFGLIEEGIDSVLGRPFDNWLDAVASDTLRNAIAACGASGPSTTDADVVLEIKGRSFNLAVHRMEASHIVELEPVALSVVDSTPVLARTLSRLQSAVGLQALHEITVREIRELTGCDRVVIYAFGPDGHGKVLAEAKADDVDSYLGLHFPASDIPAQARELYKLNWLRMIPDVDYEPIPILGLQTAAAGAPLDLSFSMLRSVSPIHREYMRHMGTASSMSISLLRNGELWGLVSCVHRSPKLLSREVRAACLSLGRLLSLQISALEGLAESRLVESNERLLAPLTGQLREASDEILSSLVDTPEALLQLTDATGAAILVGDRLQLIGHCPTEAEVSALAHWAAGEVVGQGSFSTHRLPAEYAPAEAFAQRASGLLAIILPKPVLSMLLWFRPEVTQTVLWAGEPNKVPVLDARTSTLRLSPRNSFEAWKTSVRHQSIAWAPHQLHAARDLRRIAIELDLADQVVREQKAVASRDELVAVVSHDLRSPMTVVALQASMLIRTLVADTSVPSRRMLVAVQSIQRAVSRMSEMLRDLLDLSTIEQGRYNVELKAHRVEELFEESDALLAPIAETKRITLKFTAPPGLVVNVDAERLYQVISNLVGNALKFTPEGGSVDVLARPDGDSGGKLVQFMVADTGIGMPTDQMAHVFERYWHVREANPTGTGLGLYIAQGIVHAHGGTIWVESDVGVGSTFSFTVARGELPELAKLPAI